MDWVYLPMLHGYFKITIVSVSDSVMSDTSQILLDTSQILLETSSYILKKFCFIFWHCYSYINGNYKAINKINVF